MTLKIADTAQGNLFISLSNITCAFMSVLTSGDCLDKLSWQGFSEVACLLGLRESNCPKVTQLPVPKVGLEFMSPVYNLVP